MHKQVPNSENSITNAKQKNLFIFGKDMGISEYCDKKSESFSNLGVVYKLSKEENSASYLAGEWKFKVLELEVYSVNFD